MRYFNFRNAAALLAACSLLFFVGCATQRSLYHWGNYPDLTYAWLKDDPESGADVFGAMEENVQVSISKNHALPPGFYAHFGLLCMQAGDFDKAVEYWQMEKAAFPESSAFMDFLLQSIQGNRLSNTGARREVAPQVIGEEAAK